MPSSGTQRIRYFDWARALGALAVVALHVVVTTARVDAFWNVQQDVFFVEGIACIPLARGAVPAFFMMSGALMLDPAREMGWRKVGRHVWRLCFVLLTWGFAFSLVEAALDAGGLSPAVVGEAAVNTLGGRSWDHLWFLYALLVLYAITPILRPWVARASRQELGLATLVLWGALCVAPTLSLLLGVGVLDWVRLPYSLVYYLAGLYAHRYLRLDGRVVVAGVAACLAMAALRLLHVPNADDAVMPQYAFALPLGVLALCLLRRLVGETDISSRPVMRVLADYSFGIYVLHPLFCHLVVWFARPEAWPLGLLQAFMFVASIVGSVALSWLCRQIPCLGDKL